MLKCKVWVVIKQDAQPINKFIGTNTDTHRKDLIQEEITGETVSHTKGD